MDVEMKLLSVVGARPQFVKLFPLCRAIETYNTTSRDDPIQSVIAHTGQHYDNELSRVFFDQMQLPSPDYNLGVGSGSHGRQTGTMLEQLEDVLEREKPSVVIVFGDTNSTLAGALAAVKLHFPVAHVEAGLRSYNKAMPEEINRIITDHVSTLLFCPTERAVENLQREGFTSVLDQPLLSEKTHELLRHTSASNPLVVKTGDIMYDAFLFNIQLAEKSSTILKNLSLTQKAYAVLTLHRSENTESERPLSKIITFLESKATEAPLVFPIHPRTLRFIGEHQIQLPKHVRAIPPVSYLDMLVLEKHASCIYTDSGGVQKEAFFLGVPCVTLRDETEWTETVESGWNRLMKDAVRDTSNPRELRPNAADLFGNGRAAEHHLWVLAEYCKVSSREIKETDSA